MGCAASGEVNKEDQSRSKEIDSNLRKEKKFLENEIKLLLLGAGESGKSTISKQMKIIYLKGFTDNERRPYREIIFSNIIMSMRSLVLAVDKFGDQVLEENKEKARLFKSNTILFEQTISPEVQDAISSLWKDPVIIAAYKRSAEFQLNDSASIYFNDLDRITAKDFIPNDADILRSRARTTGISEITFTAGPARFRLVDVGGQRSERKKWIHCFQDVTGLVFCVSLAEYDLKLYEDETVNRMHESIMLFDEICNCQWFNDTSFILFLNKSDIFRDKIKDTSLDVCFPDYKGGCNFQKAIDYITAKFSGLNRNPEKEIYSHVTCATDTSNVKFVFEAVREIVMRESLARAGIMT